MGRTWIRTVMHIMHASGSLFKPKCHVRTLKDELGEGEVVTGCVCSLPNVATLKMSFFCFSLLLFLVSLISLLWTGGRA